MTAPRDHRISAHWHEKAREVDAANGEYVLVAEGVTSALAHRIKTGKIVAFRPRGAYTAVTRTTSEPGIRVDVYAAKVL